MARSGTTPARQAALIAALAALAALTLAPLAMLLLISQKTNGEVYYDFFGLPRDAGLWSFRASWPHVWPYVLNSLIVCGASVLGGLALSSLGGYVFARLDFAGRRPLFVLVLALMMVPGVLTLVPAFLWFKQFPLVGGNDWLGRGGTGFLNSRLALIIPAISGAQVLGIALCRVAVERIPKELFESATLDGATELQAYRHVALPLTLPTLATLAILSFVGVYNEFVWPLVTINDRDLQVFSVGVTRFAAEGNLQYGPMMAGYAIGAVPLIAVFAVGMRYYVAGLTAGAVKG